MPSPIDPQGSEVAGALARLKADPVLGGETTVRNLRWLSDSQGDSQPQDMGWLKWLGELFGWIAQSGRVIVWIGALVLAALLALYLYRLVRDFRRSGREAAPSAPSHVRDLDIRPESLPADVGAAARQLWEQGEHRAALALLYRGLLSRLVHDHGVSIRESSTEGDCLALLAGRPALEPAAQYRNEYATRLVRAWQRAVYGAQEPDDATMLELCAGFAAALDRTPAQQPAMQAA